MKKIAPPLNLSIRSHESSRQDERKRKRVLKRLLFNQRIKKLYRERQYKIRTVLRQFFGERPSRLFQCEPVADKIESKIGVTMDDSRITNDYFCSCDIWYLLSETMYCRLSNGNELFKIAHDWCVREAWILW